MRIMYCIPTLEYGGAERHLSQLAGELSGMGNEIHVVFLREGIYLERLKKCGVTLHCIGGGRNYDPKIFFRLVKLIQKQKPDIIQTALMQMDIIGGGAALVTRTRWVLKESSSAAAYPANWKSRLRAVIAKGAQAIVSNSQGGDAYWRSRGVKAIRYVIRNGIPLAEIANTNSTSMTDLILEPGEKMVLYAGRMDSGKNVENLILSLCRISDELPFRALLCGDGPARPALEELVTKLGLERRIIFTGYVDNLWALMKQADAFAFLSRFEGCPYVVLEAMACGCPLVISDIPAHRELLDEQSARFTAPDEPGEIAEALKDTLLSSQAARVRASMAQARAGECTIRAMAEQYEQVFLGVIDGGHSVSYGIADSG
jgi:glycosyltransferase involved in cell wall biosynthesis